MNQYLDNTYQSCNNNYGFDYDYDNQMDVKPNVNELSFESPYDTSDRSLDTNVSFNIGSNIGRQYTHPYTQAYTHAYSQACSQTYSEAVGQADDHSYTQAYNQHNSHYNYGYNHVNAPPVQSFTPFPANWTVDSGLQSSSGHYNYTSLQETQRTYAYQHQITQILGTHDTHDHRTDPRTDPICALQLQTCDMIPKTVEELDLKPSQSSLSSSQASSGPKELVIDESTAYMSRQRLSVIETNHCLTNGDKRNATNYMGLSGTTSGDEPSVKRVVHRRRGQWRKNLSYDQIMREKRESNRLAALRCRQKKLDAIDKIEKVRDVLTNENMALEAEVSRYRQLLHDWKLDMIYHQITECQLQKKASQPESPSIQEPKQPRNP
ncbi:unnamed protein product [Medioppia subpectinata]|uniref:BZIP domain-containing protein n=1 Tax=Medioppia subpectinata TaxID=1979941 RepID=A0A7R9KG63_9ACAR|nr:unnamed protein product [Medioppia subpectinata]CAG2101585.1 unnamed protein product [Medioppia subpectinata]